jgi:hypothetical protein
LLSCFSSAKILIVNNGQEAIGESDISQNEPLRVKVSEPHEILEAKVHFSGNNNVVINKMNPQEFSIDFEFLNPKEGIIINFLHDGTPPEEIEILGRIKGISTIENINSERKNLFLIIPFIVGGLISAIPTFLMDYLSNTLTFDSWFDYLILFSPILLIFFIYFVYRYSSVRFFSKPTYIDILKKMMN